MEIEFQGQYDKQTLFQAARLANQPSRRSALLRYGFVALVVLIFAAYFYFVATQQDPSTMDLFRSGRHLISLPLLLYFLFQPVISSYVLAARLWKSPSMQRPQVGVISERGIAYGPPSTGRKETEWSRFARKHVTESLIVLLTADGVLSFFPRRFFKTDSDWRIVRQWADSRVSQAA